MFQQNTSRQANKLNVHPRTVHSVMQCRAYGQQPEFIVGSDIEPRLATSQVRSALLLYHLGGMAIRLGENVHMKVFEI